MLSLTKDIAAIGMNILMQFLDTYEPKNAFRNTVNDVLILATAIRHLAKLATEDNLLRRFAAEISEALCEKTLPRGLIINFSTPEVRRKCKSFGAKGFINRGWQVKERRGGGFC